MGKFTIFKKFLGMKVEKYNSYYKINLGKEMLTSLKFSS